MVLQLLNSSTIEADKVSFQNMIIIMAPVCGIRTKSILSSYQSKPYHLNSSNLANICLQHYFNDRHWSPL